MDSEGKDYFYLQRDRNSCRSDTGNVLTALGSPQRWSDILADQTPEESIANAFRAVIFEVANREGVRRVW